MEKQVDANKLLKMSHSAAVLSSHNEAKQTSKLTQMSEPPAGGAHHSPPRGAGQRARGEELLPAGERQDQGLLGNL